MATQETTERDLLVAALAERGDAVVTSWMRRQQTLTASGSVPGTRDLVVLLLNAEQAMARLGRRQTGATRGWPRVSR